MVSLIDRGRSKSTRILMMTVILLGLLSIVAAYQGSSSYRPSKARVRRGGASSSSAHQQQQEDEIIQSGIWLGRRRGGGGQNAGVAGLILKTIGGIFRRMFGALAPSKRLSWTEAFEEEFGRKHPTYIEAPSLLQAATLARANCKFLIVYLPSHSARDEKKHKAFCRTLTDPDVIKMTRSSFIMWSPSTGTPVLKAAAKELKAKRQPYLAVIHMGQKNKKMTVKSVHHFKPPPTPEQAVVWLNRTMEIHGHVLEEDKKDKAYFVKEAKLISEQSQEYTKALQADKHNEAKEKREAKEKAEREAAAKKKAAEDLARRAKKEAALGAEPEGQVDGVCRVAVRLANGTKVQRTFLATDRLEKVFDWMDVQGLDLDSSCLVRTRPKRSFIYPQDKDLTLQEDAGLVGAVLLLVENKPTTAAA